MTILDGYTDEPAGLGVPPYLDVNVRYAAGAIWYVDRQAAVRYYTIDEARSSWGDFFRVAKESDLVIVIAGVVVPGKYLGGRPMGPEEVVRVGAVLSSMRAKSVLAGPAAVFGMGERGGSVATPPWELGKHYDFVVKGDVEVFLRELLTEGEERADPSTRRTSYELTDRFATLGARIVLQHPNYNYNLMVELETFRGCARWFTGGCSFCIEPGYGKPIQRSREGVLREIEALYALGVRGFRLGRQTDFLLYGADLSRNEEFPKPNPEFLEGFLREVSKAVPEAIVHIDNVNPGTIAKHPEESLKGLRYIAEYLSPGNVAALGVESADEKVIERNNLKALPEESLRAVELVNKAGRDLGWNGLPKLLPGINFVLMLPGETKETYYRNLEFLEAIARRGLLVRRINVRRVLVLPTTRLAAFWSRRLLKRHEKVARWFVWKVRHFFEPLFLSRVAPKGAVLREVFVERTVGGLTYARQMGSYPIVVELHGSYGKPCVLDVEVVRHKGRSLVGKALSECRPPPTARPCP